MKQIIEKLHNLNRSLLSNDANKAIEILSREIKLKEINIPSGTKCFTWTVPKFWVVKSATLTDLKNNKVVLDYKNNPLHLYVGSLPFEGDITFGELEKHLRYKTYFENNENTIPYVFKYYDLDWGFCLSRKQFLKLDRTAKYRVSIKTQYKSDYLKIGEVTIKGRTDKEIIIIAHTDHPFQSNDNLSGVAVALELAKRLKKEDKLSHTIKILFLPETIGSIAYVWKRQKQLHKIKAVMALDIVGNKNRVLIQKYFNPNHEINFLSEAVVKAMKLKYEMAGYREHIGSDELIFSDPLFNIPAIMLSTWPYPEYHTNLDTPDIISEEMLTDILEVCLKWIKTFDRNFIPKRLWKGPLMRSKVGWFMGKQPEDRHLELLGYLIDGKSSILELAQKLNMDIDLAMDFIYSLKKQKLII